MRNSVRVLGMRVDCVDMAEAVAGIRRLLETREGGLVATVNPEIIMRARRDAEYARLLDGARLCLADGVGVLWAARRAGCRLPDRVTGVDLVEALAAPAAREGWRVFLLGAREGVARRAAAALQAAHPQLVVVGIHSGTPDPAADAETHAMIRTSGAQLVLVAFGFPQQERWVARMCEALPGVVGIGVGGAFDFIAGAVPRAPSALRRVGLEWAFRLAVQPWRIRRMSVLPIYALQVVRERREK